nr:hypothetical protein L204_04050 [Cryptococcus depauperatus CBS 7855]
MSSSMQVTPRKRKAGPVHEETGSTISMTTPRSKRSLQYLSKQQFVPLPTPSTTRHEKVHIAKFDPALSILTPESKKSKTVSLPPHLESLLSIHRAFNLALSLHIATHHPVLPPHSSTVTSIKLPNLTNYLAIKETVERTCGKRFGSQELGRLAWIWSWDGKDLPDERAISEKNKKAMLDEDNPFVAPSSPAIGYGEISGLNYLVTSTRCLDPFTGRRVYTHGIGIDLDLRKGETRQILPNSDGGLGNRGQGGGTGAIGRWNANGEIREEIFRERLERWIELHGGYELPQSTALPTPTTSENSQRSVIPPIPVLPLPHLPSSSSLPAANLMKAFTSPSSTLTPKKTHLPPSTSTLKTVGLDDPFEIAQGPEKGLELPKGKVVRNGSVEERRKAMMDRIKARSRVNKGATLGSSVGGLKRPGVDFAAMSTAGQQEELRRRSTLSRLENVAEGVWMMFSSPYLIPSTLPNAPRGRRKAIPISEVADVIVKSSKTPISTAEAQSSLQMLTELCPFFLTTKTIGRQEWLEMPSTALSVAPPSPNNSIVASPSTSSSLIRVPGGSPSTPARLKMELAGPASPGRVRRQGGLREVRERIRQELGE